jgi:hypothetical protein
MRSVSDNMGIAVALALVILSGLLLPLAVNQTFGSHEVVFEGTPIADTIFSEVVSERPDPAMLPGGPVNRTKDTLYLRADYSPLITVNLTGAINRARNFMSGVTYLANRTINLVYSDYTEFPQATWYLKFNVRHTDLYAGVSVNAISGKIVSYDPIGWYNLSNPYVKDPNTTHILDTSAVEASALEFFKTMNYTLSPYTMVLPPVLETEPYYFSESQFTIRFYCVMNDTLIDGNEISLHLDIETGEVLSFYYSWTYFRQIPSEGVISVRSAEQAARSYINGFSDFPAVRFTSSMLTLRQKGVDLVNESNFRLMWIIQGTISPDATPITIGIYPLSGALCYWSAYIWLEGGPFVKQTQVSIILVGSTLGFSLAVAGVSLVLVRKQLSLTDASLEQET